MFVLKTTIAPATIVGIRKLRCYLPHDPPFIRLDKVQACDGRTDRRIYHRYCSAVHCKQCGRTIKKTLAPLESDETCYKKIINHTFDMLLHSFGKLKS